MARVLVFSGAGHYADPWHRFRETSRAVSEILGGSGHDVVVRDSEPGALLDLSDFNLLVVNSGGRTEEPNAEVTADWVKDHSAISAFHRFGSPIIGLHTAVGTFPDWNAWTSIIGGRWTSDSFHPKLGKATFHPAGAADHPIWSGLQSVSVIDERYTMLQRLGTSAPLISHSLQGREHVMGWVAGEKVVYDGLGHDVRSYESADRRQLLRNEVEWLLAGRDRMEGLESTP